MQRLMMVSNRLPVTVSSNEDGLQYQQSAGGLATGLSSFYQSYRSIWLGWPGISEDELDEKLKEKLTHQLLSEFGCYPIHLSDSEMDAYYYGFSNKTIWPLFHYFTQYTAYDRPLWEAYQFVNRKFCDAIVEVAKPGDTIWIHDYHLMLLPRILREQLPEATVGFFLHIPFPSSEIFRLLPWRSEILVGLLGADVVGFHTYEYARHFMSSVHRLLGYEYRLGQVIADDRIVTVDAFPMGIDYDRFSTSGEAPEVRCEMATLRERLPEDSKVILSVDRLDYTKGIPQRLEAFDSFLAAYPEYREKVTLILVAVPSREEVEHYDMLNQQVNELVGKINGEHGTIGWTPIQYLHRGLPFPQLAALYNIADVAVVTPLRDGMNLVAKEYVATRRDGMGVLVLSEMAGAAQELGEAISINPNDDQQIVEALRVALSMPVAEQKARNRAMQQRIRRYNVVRWAEEFVDKLKATKQHQQRMLAKLLTPAAWREMLRDYRSASSRLLLLDYDGTLTPFFGNPEQARPSDRVLELLRNLAENPQTEAVIISGRDKETLERWFGALRLGLVAEHGVWVREADGEWEMIEPLRNEWKDEIRFIIELYVDRTPGSFIEEKEFSLAWHYRRTTSELGLMRTRELIDELVNLTATLNLQVLEGNKVVEVKNVGINKGRAALRWLAKRDWDFVLAIGDDWTDEDMFEVMPEDSYSLKVGLSPTKAKLNLRSPRDVLALLGDLMGDPVT